MEWESGQAIAQADQAVRWGQRNGPRKRFSTPDQLSQVATAREELYCIANAEDLTRAENLELTNGRENRDMTRMIADQELQTQIANQTDGAGQMIVIPEYEVVG